MVHHKVCPLCLSGNISLHLRCTDHYISKEVFEVNKCMECGFQFTQDYPEDSEIGKYYESEDYISHSDTAKGFSNKLYRLARKIMLRRKLSIIRKFTGLNKGSLLDIGSGTGHFADTMRKAGWQVRGIEINEKARRYATSTFGVEILGPENISTIQTGSFDCITLWHVLEHFHDPDWYFSQIARLLKSDGKIVIALPNCGSFDASHYKENWAAWDVPRHIWHFNPVSFALFAKQRGYTVQMKRYLPFDVFYISILSERQRGSLIPLPAGMFRGLIFSLKTLFNTDRGSSLVYVLKREGS